MAKALPVHASRMATRQTLPGRPAAFVRPEQLTDPQGRSYSYLRLSVTDRCDLACVYCMPAGGESEHGVRSELLSFEEIVSVVQVFCSMGVRRLRLTGGEPLIRRDMVKLISLVRQTCPDLQIAMTTNATLLAELAAPLVAAGLSSVNVSMDTLVPERFARLTRGGDLARVLRGIEAAQDAGLRVKLNVVPLHGENFLESEALVAWAWQRDIVPRFIELMPLGEGAHLAAQRASAEEVRARLGDMLEETVISEREDSVGPARYWKSRDGRKKVGFITPVSDEFCGSCNRVRVTALGDIRACLASRRAVSLRDILRAGGTSEDLAWAIAWSLAGKDPSHYFLEPSCTEHEHVGMSLIGG